VGRAVDADQETARSPRRSPHHEHGAGCPSHDGPAHASEEEAPDCAQPPGADHDHPRSKLSGPREDSRDGRRIGDDDVRVGPVPLEALLGAAGFGPADL
jgi:hypothetical protein